MPNHQQEALFHMNEALNYWKKYAFIYTTKYKPALYNRVGFVDAVALTKNVEQGIEMVKNWKPEKPKSSN